MFMAEGINAKKKRHPTFNVPNYGAKSRSRVKPRWRSQRGEDNKKRIKKSFMGALPSIGYRNPEALRHVRSDGTIPILVHNANELRALLENPEDSNVSVTIAAAVGKRKRAEIIGLAAKNKIRVTNGASR